MHLWAIFAGLGAISLPLFVHWLTRPRPRRMAISTIRFIQEIVHQRRATHRLRDLLVLLARVAAILLLALAFARPQARQKQLVTPQANGDTVRIVVLDTSQSMAAVDRGVSAFERGRSLAGRYLEYQRGMQANLLLCAADCRAVFDRPSANFAALREQLAQANPVPERLATQSAINAAAAMLQKAEAGTRRELLVISDFQRTNWAGVDLSVLPEGVVLSLQGTGAGGAEGGEVPANLGVLAVRPTGRPEQGRPLMLEVEVGNYSSAARDVQVEITLGEVTQRAQGFCPAGGRSAFSVQMPVMAAGWYTGSARLLGIDDALPADNSRPFALQVQPSPTYLLVTRQNARPHASSSHFIERALVPHVPEKADAVVERVLRVDPLNMDLGRLAMADMVVLDHPGTLSDEQIGWIGGILRRGRGVFYIASEPADAVNLKRLATSAGTDLKMPVEFAPASAGGAGSAGAGAAKLSWADFRQDVAPFSAFGQSMKAAAAELRFANCLVTRRLEGGLDSDVLITYSDRSAALVQTACGPGMLAVLNTDLLTSNLAGSPVFPPLVAEVTAKLIQRHGAAELECGEPASLWLPQDQMQQAGLRIIGPQEGMDCGALVQDAKQISWRCPRVSVPGVYTIHRGDQVVFAAAAAVSDQESDLTPLTPQTLTARMAAGHNAEFRSADVREEPREYWPWFVGGCALLVLLEWGLLRGFRS